jgi:uncharacterized membrane protein (DUF373 family)
MADGASEDESVVESTVDLSDGILRGFATQSEFVMELLELSTAIIMIILFGIGVFDLGLKLFTMVETGNYTDPDRVVQLIDTALLLLIIVEVYRTIIAYIEDLNILPLVITVAIIAMARKIISFRTSKFPSYDDALLAALTYGFLLLVLIATFYLVHRSQELTKFDIYSEPFSSVHDQQETAEVSDD